MLVACGSEFLLILLWPGLAPGAVSLISLELYPEKSGTVNNSVSTERCSPVTHLEKQKVNGHTSC